MREAGLLKRCRLMWLKRDFMGELSTFEGGIGEAEGILGTSEGVSDISGVDVLLVRRSVLASASLHSDLVTTSSNTSFTMSSGMVSLIVKFIPSRISVKG